MELQVINSQEVLGKEFRVYGDAENPLFLAKDVANWIEHSNLTEMVRSVDEDEKLNSTILSAGQNREMTFLTENGMYEVLMLSRKPIAKQFKKKVKEILKDIRKQGMYMTDEVAKLAETDLETFFAKALVIAKGKIDRLELALDEAKPSVLFVEQFVDTSKCFLFREVSKLYDIPERVLMDWLRNHRIIFKQNNVNMAYSTYAEYFAQKVVKKENGAYSQTCVTPKGVEWLAKRLRKDGFLLDDEAIAKAVKDKRGEVSNFANF